MTKAKGLKTFARYQMAAAAANGAPILRVGGLYIVGIDRLTEIAVLATDDEGGITGYISAGHLDRLGRGNNAYAAAINPHRAFPVAGLMHTFHHDHDAKAWEAQEAARKAAV